MDEQSLKVLRAVAYGFVLAQIAARQSVTDDGTKLNEHFRREALAIVNSMMDMVPKETA